MINKSLIWLWSHLITVISLAFTVVTLLYFNACPKKNIDDNIITKTWGWPYIYEWHSCTWSVNEENIHVLGNVSCMFDFWWKNLVINIVVSLIIIYVVGYISKQIGTVNLFMPARKKNGEAK